MDQQTFTNITGQSISSAQEARFQYLLTQSSDDLAEALGHPLDPTDWDDQYEEIGKVPSDSWNGNLDDLDEPDETEGSTRLFKWSRDEPYLFIDPATRIYSIKLVRMDSYGSEDGNGVTFRTFDPKGYTLRYQNGRDGAWGKYVKMSDDIMAWRRDVLWFQWPSLRVLGAAEDDLNVQLAIDADWAFEELPARLLRAQADMIAYSLDDKRDIKSESLLGHSYTRNVRQDPAEQHRAVISQYAGPRGTASQGLVFV